MAFFFFLLPTYTEYFYGTIVSYVKQHFNKSWNKEFQTSLQIEKKS